MKFQYSDLLVRDLHTNSCNTLRSSTGSLTLLLHLVCIKVSASLATALIPPHVLAQILLPDHPAVHCPLVACTLVRESSFGQEKKGETSRLAREQHCRCDQNHCIWGKKGPILLLALEIRWWSFYQNIRLLEMLAARVQLDMTGERKPPHIVPVLSQWQIGLDEQNAQSTGLDLSPWTRHSSQGEAVCSQGECFAKAHFQ